MNELAKRVMQHSILRAGGYAFGAALYFAAIVLIGRYLGAENFGHFSFILALVGIFQLIADMGVRNILIRNMAVDRGNFKYHLGIARTLLWSLSVVSMAGIVIVVNLIDLADEVRQAAYVAGLAVLFTFYALGYSAVLRAFDEMEWDILGFVLHKVFFMMLVLGVSRTNFGLQGVYAAMLLANIGLWLYFRELVGRRHGRTQLSLNFEAAWALLAEAFPLGVAEILRRLTQHVDKLLLAAFSTPVAVGLFSASYKFLETMNPFVLNLTLPLFPVFSRLAQVSPIRVLRAYDQSLKFLYVMGVPLAVILFVFAEQIMTSCFGAAYSNASVTLRLFAPAVLLLLPNSVCRYVFTVLGRQHLYTGCAAVYLLTNTTLDVLLIPRYGYRGAAIGTLTAEMVLFFAALTMLRRFGGGLACLQLLWRPLLAGLGMACTCWLVRDRGLAWVVGGVLSGLAVYACLLFALQTFTRQERTLFTSAIRVRVGSVSQ